MRFAAIDIGSNAIRLLISDIVENTPQEYTPKKNTLIRVPLRLGDDAFLDKKLSERKTADLLKTMSAFKNLLDVYKVSDYMACATSALRETSNGPEIVGLIKQQAGLDITIIEGKTEAAMIYATHAEQLLDKRKSYLYIDVGGGSTELSLFTEGTMVASNSFNIGTIRMLDNQDTDETWAALKTWVKTETAQIQNLQAIGTGGNINKLYRLSEEKGTTPLTVSKLKILYTYLNGFSLKERISVLGLKQDRADVIIPAAEIFLCLARWANFKQIYVPSTGLVDGIIQLLIEKHQARTGQVIS